MSQIEGLEAYNRESNQMNQMPKSYCCKIFQQQGIGTQAIQQQCLGTQATGLIPRKEEIGEFCEGAKCHMVRMCKGIGNGYIHLCKGIGEFCEGAKCHMTIARMQQNNEDLMRQLQGEIANKKGDEEMEIEDESSIEIEYKSGQNKNKSEIKSINWSKEYGRHVDKRVT
ncbi:hypothetical protein GJ496_002293 [Pomphorhynchus laevis]|nr:hypothetical protein GJ496_002293 [Pomphorhynchus laevis]